MARGGKPSDTAICGKSVMQVLCPRMPLFQGKDIGLGQIKTGRVSLRCLIGRFGIKGDKREPVICGMGRKKTVVEVGHTAVL